MPKMTKEWLENDESDITLGSARSVRSAFEWFVTVLEEGYSIETDDQGNISAVTYGEPRITSHLTIEKLKKLLEMP